MQRWHLPARLNEEINHREVEIFIIDVKSPTDLSRCSENLLGKLPVRSVPQRAKDSDTFKVLNECENPENPGRIVNSKVCQVLADISCRNHQANLCRQMDISIPPLSKVSAPAHFLLLL